MTNAEKYKDLVLNCENYCKDFVRPIVLATYEKKCDNIGCIRCQSFVLLFLQEEYIEPPICWEDIAIDTPILVSNTETDGWVRRHFAKYEGGKIHTWSDGRTSFTRWGTHYLETWKHAKLAEETGR